MAKTVLPSMMTGKGSLPGTNYSRNGRYWWKVQLPGQDKPAAFPWGTKIIFA